MTILLQQLLNVVTVDQSRQKMIDMLTALQFNATSWHDGSIQKTAIEVVAQVHAAVSFGVSEIAAGGYNDLAEKVWLHLFSDSHYDNQVNLAVATQGTCVLTSSASAPPYPIDPNDLIAETEDGTTFRNTTGGTLATGGTLSLTWVAEVAGAAGNVPVNTIVRLKTSLAGVTIDNPAISGSDTWITLDGADEENDVQLRFRNKTKWSTLGIGPGMSYEHNARKAHASVKRTRINATNPRGPGTIDLYLASDSGTISPSVVSLVDDYMHGVTDGIDRVGTTADLLILSAIAYSFSLPANVYVLKQYDTTATRAAVEAGLAEYFKNLPIGGTPLTPGGAGAIRVGAMAGSVMKIPGLQNIAFPGMPTDLPLTFNRVAIPTISLNWYQI